MVFIVLFLIFIIFVGFAGSILRKKLYKRLLSLSLSLNALIVFAGIVAHANDSFYLRVFCVCSIFAIMLIVGVAFYICHETTGQRMQ